MTLKRLNADGTYDTISGKTVVADNLTSDSATKALSAKQGMLLKKSLDDLLGSYMQKVYDGIFPVNTLIFGFQKPNVPSGVSATWTEQTGYSGRYLKIDSDTTAGTTLDEQLPNIKGSVARVLYKGNWWGSGALSPSNYYGMNCEGGNWGQGGNVDFNANTYNSVYKDDGKVQPLTVTIKMWKRTK